MADVDAFTEEVLSDCLEGAAAWQALHDPTVAGTLDAEGFYKLCLAAGYTEATAQKAASERAWERLTRDLKA